jgi:hypothetical protein
MRIYMEAACAREGNTVRIGDEELCRRIWTELLNTPESQMLGLRNTLDQRDARRSKQDERGTFLEVRWKV